MMHLMKWIVPVVALGLLLSYAQIAKSEEAAATGTVKVSVVNKEGKGVADAKVRLVVPPKPAAKGAGEGRLAEGEGAAPPPRERPKSVAEGTTDKDGKVTLEKVPAGEYMAHAVKEGLMGRGAVTVKAGESAEVTITVAPRERPRAGGEGH